MRVTVKVSSSSDTSSAATDTEKLASVDPWKKKIKRGKEIIMRSSLLLIIINDQLTMGDNHYSRSSPNV